MKQTNIGLAEARVSRNANETLMVVGIGSSVVLALYEPQAQVGGIAHVMLPRTRGDERWPAKYANTAAEHLVALMAKAGAEAGRLSAAIIGGGTLLAKGQTALLDLGQRTVAGLRDELERMGLPVCLTETGGTAGRSCYLHIGTGTVTVRVLTQPDRVYDHLTRGAEVPQ